jgi:hypothetical protein
MKIRSVWAELLHEDRRTDRLIVAFHNFAKERKRFLTHIAEFWDFFQTRHYFLFEIRKVKFYNYNKTNCLLVRFLLLFHNDPLKVWLSSAQVDVVLKFYSKEQNNYNPQKLLSAGILSNVGWYRFTEVSEKFTASIFKLDESWTLYQLKEINIR